MSAPPGYNLTQTPNFTPQQMQIFNKLSRGASKGLGKGLESLGGLAAGNEDAFAAYEKPAFNAFEQALGRLGTKFGGLGAMGSSAFQNATSGEARQLAENLGAQRMGIQQNALDRLLGLSENILGQRPYENYFTPQKQGPDWGSLLGTLGGAAAGAFGGPVAGAAVSQGLPALLKLFGLGS